MDDRRIRALDAAENFSMLVDDEDPAVTRLHVVGELDIATISRFRRLLARVIAARPGRIEVDISKVDLVETVSAAGLLRARQEALDQGIELEIERASPSVGAMLALAEARLGRPRPPKRRGDR
jgi:anti-anti-sigma factor